MTIDIDKLVDDVAYKTVLKHRDQDIRDNLVLTYDDNSIRYKQYRIRVSNVEIGDSKRHTYTLYFNERELCHGVMHLDTIFKVISLLEKNHYFDSSQLLRVERNYSNILWDVLTLRYQQKHTSDNDRFDILKAKESYKRAHLKHLEKELTKLSRR